MSLGGQGKENFPTLQTRDAVAEQIGFGSGKQYEKAKFIFDNADEDMINLLDEKKISIHKAYVTLKEQLNEKESQLKQLEENNKGDDTYEYF